MNSNLECKILNGKEFSKEIIEKLKTRVSDLSEDKQKPKLVAIVVGDDPASHIYIKHKVKACKNIGFLSEVIHLPENSSYINVKKVINDLNNDKNTHGILLQVPLPKHLAVQQEELLQLIIPDKDVDCFNFFNFGKILKGYSPVVYPCTPYGIIKLIKKYKISLIGKNVTIIGFSNIVGKPLGIMLESEGATITACNIFTKDIKSHTVNADIIICATGKKDVIIPDMVKEDSVIIDAGIIKLENNKIRGDTDYKKFMDKCSYITPVPGGVGPVTIAMLMENLWKLYINSKKII